MRLVIVSLLLYLRVPDVCSEEVNVTISEDSDDWIEDNVWESMLRVAAQDFITRANRDREVYNVSVDPLELRTLLGERVSQSEWVPGYTVNMTMWGLVLHGLADMELDQVRVERTRDLDMVRARVIVRPATVTTSQLSNSHLSNNDNCVARAGAGNNIINEQKMAHYCTRKNT